MKFFKIYTPFAVNEFKRQLAYRFSAFGWAIANMISVLLMFFLWKAVYSSSNTEILRGFTLTEITVYICVQKIVGSLIGSRAGWVIGRDVVQGTISMSLIKPINYSASIYFQDIGLLFFQMIVVCIPLLLIVYLALGWVFSPLLLLLFFASVFLSKFIYFFFDVCFSMLSFYTTYIWGLNMSKEAIVEFLSGSLIPIAFFPEVFQTVFKFLPFQYMVYTPTMLFLGKYSLNDFLQVICIQLVWILILFTLSKVLWHRATKRLTILGG